MALTSNKRSPFLEGTALRMPTQMPYTPDSSLSDFSVCSQFLSSPNEDQLWNVQSTNTIDALENLHYTPYDKSMFYTTPLRPQVHPAPASFFETSALDHAIHGGNGVQQNGTASAAHHLTSNNNTTISQQPIQQRFRETYDNPLSAVERPTFFTTPESQPTPIAFATSQHMRLDEEDAPPETAHPNRKRKADDTASDTFKQSKRKQKDTSTCPAPIQNAVQELLTSMSAPEDVGSFHNYHRDDAQQRIFYQGDKAQFHKLPACYDDSDMADDAVIVSLGEAFYRALFSPPTGARSTWPKDIRDHVNEREQYQYNVIHDKLSHHQHQLTVSARVKELIHLAKDLHTKGLPISAITNLEVFTDEMIENDDYNLSELPIKVKGGYLLEEDLPLVNRILKMIKACSNKHVAKDIVSGDFEDLHALIWAPDGFTKRKENNSYTNARKAITKQKGRAAVEQLKGYNDVLANFNIDEAMAASAP